MPSALRRVLHRMQEFFQNIIAALDSLLLFPSLFRHTTTSSTTSKPFPRPTTTTCSSTPRSLDDFANEISSLLSSPLSPSSLKSMSSQLRHQLRHRLQSDPISMLPSYNHALPTGNERGTFLALDVGGSTFRVALIDLRGRAEDGGGVKVLRSVSLPIDKDVKALVGTKFFDWMAEKIATTLESEGEKYTASSSESVLPMGLSWSFPIDQTSIRSGLMIGMGKGFMCSNGTVGMDLGQLIAEACQRRDLNVRVDAIVNDSSATLLCRAYADPKTRMSLILGTGTNVAIHFPVRGVGVQKFGDRSKEWWDRASHVIINTELSMFGGGILPTTRWDDYLNKTHLRPDYQPLEYLATGRYLGEIVRLIMVEAVETAGLFGGELPSELKEPYSFDTAIVAFIEADSSASLAKSAALLQKEHSFATTPSFADLLFLRKVSSVVSRRAAAYIATGIHSLWGLYNEAEYSLTTSTTATDSSTTTSISTTKAAKNPEIHTRELELVTDEEDDLTNKALTIACDGGVINNYPGFRDRCQAYLDQLTSPCTTTTATSSPSPPTSPSLSPSDPSSIILELEPESALIGAAVAVAVAVSDEYKS
ncbi:hypothetical protein FQN54_002783 [Arachnomyces sp. PD_36]|nr:hypothetical protein FQN54_002783 [Arachnomyces sp. PD_36]